MDKYQSVVHQHVTLCRKLLEARLKEAERLLVGVVIRNNRIRHTKIMLLMLDELLEAVRHDPEEWYEDDSDLPF